MGKTETLGVSKGLSELLESPEEQLLDRTPRALHAASDLAQGQTLDAGKPDHLTVIFMSTFVLRKVALYAWMLIRVNCLVNGMVIYWRQREIRDSVQAIFCCRNSRRTVSVATINLQSKQSRSVISETISM